MSFHQTPSAGAGNLAVSLAAGMAAAAAAAPSACTEATTEEPPDDSIAPQGNTSARAPDGGPGGAGAIEDAARGAPPGGEEDAKTPASSPTGGAKPQAIPARAGAGALRRTAHTDSDGPSIAFPTMQPAGGAGGGGGSHGGVDSSYEQRQSGLHDIHASLVPPSPSCSVASSTSMGGASHSDHEPLDSPSSLSSWNSFVGARRGDLADVEDLDLDGGLYSADGPELETVSEAGEDSNYADVSDRPTDHSDVDDGHHAAPTGSGAASCGVGEGLLSARRKMWSRYSGIGGLPPAIGLFGAGVGYDAASGTHHASHLLPHFSPRNQGHGLSHTSRYNMRTPSSLVARRRKGRIAELAVEEAREAQAGGAPNAAMPQLGATETPPQSSDSVNVLPRARGDGTGILPSRRVSAGSSATRCRTVATATERTREGSQGRTNSMPTTTGPLSSSVCSSWQDFEFIGPPAPPPRSVSPSETIPAVPSPLCECVIVANADEGNAVGDRDSSLDRGEVAASVAAKGGQQVDDSVETMKPREGSPADVRTREPSSLLHRGEAHEAGVGLERSGRDSAPPKHDSARGAAAADGFDAAAAAAAETLLSTSPASSGGTNATGASSVCTQSSSPPTTPSSSPAQLVRKSSRGRRASSPTRQKPKAPLRPCFRRRASAQAGHTGRPNSGSSSVRDSSSERESTSARGRTRVRFSPAPPQEMRTHSPVEYDRKACPVSNRLSPADVEELREMKMELGLLEAKWAAMSACKTDEGGHGEGGSVREYQEDGEDSTSDAERRRRSESISSSKPTVFCRDRFGLAADQRRQSAGDQLNHAKRTWGGSLTPAQHLAQERERERAMRLAGVGQQAGWRFNWAERERSNGALPAGGAGGARRAATSGHDALIARFGLSKPPPPLPGTTQSCPTSASPSPPPQTMGNLHQRIAGAGAGDDRSGCSYFAPPAGAAEAMAAKPSIARGFSADSNASVGTVRRERSLSPLSRQQQADGGASASLPSSKSGSVSRELDDRLQRLGTEQQQQRRQHQQGDAGAWERGRRDGRDDEEDDEEHEERTSWPSTMRDDVGEAAEESRGRRRSVTPTPSLTHTSPSPTSSSPSLPECRTSLAHRPDGTIASPSSSSDAPKLLAAPTPRPAAPNVGGAAQWGGVVCGGGYDSPASEFYESGSEYDLIG